MGKEELEKLGYVTSLEIWFCNFENPTEEKNYQLHLQFKLLYAK